MGKTQSKRSVDITTENRKGPEEAEVTGKLEKIEDVDQKQVNGDATAQESNEAEKKDDESENDKDLTTEKSAENAQTNGENGDQNTAATTTTATVAESSKEDSKEDDGADAAASAEEISPLADESMKKSKKEKVKKKWSFRSISFGKKDKQKPAKTEETNGEAEKATGEGVTEATKGEEDGAAGDAEAKPVEKLENGDATEKELNGQKTPATTPTEEKPAEVVANDQTATTTAAAATTTAASTSSDPSVSNETAMDDLTEKTAAIAISTETAAITEIVSNGADAAKNGTVETPEEATITGQADLETVSSVGENNKTIPSVANDEGCDGKNTHQNGVAAEEPEAEQQSKSQIEVKTNTDNTPAANLASSSTSTSSDPIVQNKNSDTANSSNEAASKVAMESVIVEDASETKPVKADVAATVIAEAESTDAEPNKDELVFPAAVETVKDVAEILEPEFEVIEVEAEPKQNNVEEIEPSSINAQIDVVQPPPLPISPPPSQVSVFAFKNNSESDKMPSAEMLVASSTELPTPSTQQAEIAGEHAATVSPVTEQIVDNILEQHAVAPAGLQAEIDDIAAQLESTDINAEQPKTFITVMEIEETTVIEQGDDEAIKDEKLIFATAIVDEITEKAVVIVQQQQQEENFAAEPSQQQHNMELPEEVEVEEQISTQRAHTQPTECETEMEVDVLVPVSVSVPVPILVETNVEVPAPTDLQSVDADAPAEPAANETFLPNGDDKTETIANSAENVILPPPTAAQVESENQDCSLIEMLPSKELSLNTNDDIVSATKEVASAKDLKENAAAEIITQDLPVTCE